MLCYILVILLDISFPIFHILQKLLFFIIQLRILFILKQRSFLKIILNIHLFIKYNIILLYFLIFVLIFKIFTLLFQLSSSIRKPFLITKRYSHFFFSIPISSKTFKFFLLYILLLILNIFFFFLFFLLLLIL